MKKKIKIICTLGPSSLNTKFLRYANQNVDLLRLNMSHLHISKLKKIIKFLKKNTTCPICIDTEGAQIRTKFNKKKFFKKDSIIFLEKTKNSLSFYPEYIKDKIKTNDILNIGFEGLKIKIIKEKNHLLRAKIINEGYLEGNKGIHVENRNIKLKFLTFKDYEAIEIAKKNNIKNFALSFANNINDIRKFNMLTNNKAENIFKIETKKSINNFEEMIKEANNFLIDRGDLSKDITIYKIPEVQRKIFYLKKKYKNKNIFIATNLLESMIYNNYPTRAEANDIYSCIEMGADGLVLAAETAVGKYPIECVNFTKKMIDNFNRSKNRK